MRAASVKGSSHAARGEGCQDAHGFCELDDGRVALAVADGAGSAALAATGSRVAVVAALHAFENGAPPGEAMVEARAALEREASFADHELGDLATTLAIVVVGETIEAAQVGDGAVVVCRDGEFEVLDPPARSEYLNETSFLTSSSWQSDLRLHVGSADGVSAVAVLSDGLQLLALDLATGAAHGPFFRPMLAFAEDSTSSDEELAEFLSSERVCSRTDDDKTLVVAVRAGRNGQPHG